MEQGSRSAIGPYVSNPEDNPPMAGLLRTIQKPLTTIGRIFSDDGDSQQQQQRVPPQQSAALPSVPQQQCDSSGPRNLERQPNRNDIPTEQHRSKFEAQEAAARQASAEAAEAHRIQRAEHAVVVE